MPTPRPHPDGHSPGERPAAPTPASVDWRHLHIWQIQPVRDGLLLGGIAGIVYLGYRLSLVTVPILLALLLAYLLEPLVRRLTSSRRFSRPGAAIGLIVVAGLVVVVPVVVGGWYGVIQGISAVQRLSSRAEAVARSVDKPDDQELLGRVPDGVWREMRDYLVEQDERVRAAQIRALSAPDSPEYIAIADVPEPARGYKAFQDGVRWVRQNAAELGRRALQVGSGLLSGALQAAGSFGVLLFGGFLTAFFFYFFCTGYGRVLEFWQGLIPERRKGRVFELLAKMDRVIAGFVRGRLTICGCQIVLFTLGYMIIGVPAWLVVGPVVGIVTLVPYLASVGMPLAMLLMALDPAADFRGNWWWIVSAPIVIQGISQVLDDYVLTPAIQGETTDMSMPMILFASIAGGVLGGFYGLLLAIPVAACTKILLVEVFWPRFEAWAQGRERDPLPID